MKLYYSPGACSFAPHVVLREAGTPFQLEKVDTQTHKTQAGADYFGINPKGAVPVLELENGQRLTEGPIICQYIADTARNAQLIPVPGSLERYRVMEWQNYITSELHKSFSPLFGNPAVDTAGKSKYAEALRKKLRWVSSQLKGKQFLTGDAFTVADAYLFAVSSWHKFVDIDISDCPDLQAFQARVAKRPTVKEAFAAEGLS